MSKFIARPQHVIVHNRKVEKIVEAVQKPKPIWKGEYVADKEIRQGTMHPELTHGLEDPEVLRTIGPRFRHTLCPGKMSRFLQKQKRNSH